MRKPKVCILNYGSGNVGSVFNILKLINPEVVISNEPEEILKASHLVLPGVGAFGASMEKIRKTIPLEVLKDEVFKKNKPFLGICVGMQVLADIGYEFGEHQGLGWIPGEVRRIKAGKLPLPHVGWNEAEIKKKGPLFSRFQDNPDFYFVHSYCFVPKSSAVIQSITTYGEKIVSSIQDKNIFGVQFHPEKSQQSGRVLLENFCQI